MQHPTDDRIPLWSFHKQDFSLVDDDHLDPTRSENYKSSPYIANAYRGIWRELGTDQLIWCYTRREDVRTIPRDKKEWALRVPRSAILSFLDGFVWARIIHAGNITPPRACEQGWKIEAIAQFPHDISAQHSFIDAKRDEYWNRSPPPAGWWSVLFVDDPGSSPVEGIDALIRYPVVTAWVVSDGSANRRRISPRAT